MAEMIRRGRVRRLVRAAAVCAVASVSFGLIGTGLSSEAEAHEQFGYFHNVFNGDDGLWNWDFRNDSSRNWNTKDWPVHLVFWNNATVNRVKGTDGTHLLDNNVFKTTGGNKWARFEDDGFWEYDVDKGRKRFNCKIVADYNKWTEHYRVYADATYDRNWAPGYGYYVIATTHYDYDDPEIGGGCNDAKFGWDEAAENQIAWHYSTYSAGPKWSVIADYVHLHNSTYSQGGSSFDEYIGGNLHHRNSDGSATIVHVP